MKIKSYILCWYNKLGSFKNRYNMFFKTNDKDLRKVSCIVKYMS